MVQSHPPSGGRSQSSSLRPKSDSGLALWRVRDGDWLEFLVLRHSWKLYGDDWNGGARNKHRHLLTCTSSVVKLKRLKVRAQVPTWHSEAAVHVGSVPGLDGAVDRRQSAECSLTGPRGNHDNWFLLSILVLLTEASSQTQTGTNHTGLWTGD